MKKVLRDIRVLGIHPVRPTEEEFQEALETQWGSNLFKKEMTAARRNVQEHFDDLYLIEVQIQPADAELDWAKSLSRKKMCRSQTGRCHTTKQKLIRPTVGGSSFFISSI